ncbi:hypothetical protein [Mucilaginibacter aquariorum]|uniref:Uncharacterized protein n=1 Tax=Mucilaginibacter aquariorum TaxID=2967225 RepID=A0ABT1SYX2_9SPHI|nr:hypothetical protein [Mucilaginibacter aquariorum]MCQ6957544.1 hypothetical protein [Mucilaginibacter aquariorum]
MGGILRYLTLVLLFACPGVICLAQTIIPQPSDSASLARVLKSKVNGRVDNAAKQLKYLVPKLPQVQVKGGLDSTLLKDSLKVSGLKDTLISAIGINKSIIDLRNKAREQNPVKAANATLDKAGIQLKGAGNQVSGLADSLKKLAPFKNAVKETRTKLAKFSVDDNIKQVKAAAIKSELNEKLKTFRKPDVSLALTLEDAERYQSVPPLGMNTTSKFVNVLSARGTLTAFGLPVNIDFTTDRASGMPPMGNYSNLVKFDLDPARFNSLYKNELLKYTEIRRDLLGGKDLSAYTKSKLTERLKAQRNNAEQALKDQPYAKYLDDPSSIQELLGMDRNAIVAKLKKESIGRAKEYSVKATAGIKKVAALKSTALEQVKAKKNAVNELSSNNGLQQYFGDPANIKEISLMGPGQISQKISAMIPAQGDAVKTVGPDVIFAGVNISALTRNLLAAKVAGREQVIDNIAQHIFLSSHQFSKVNFNAELEVQKRAADRGLDSVITTDTLSGINAGPTDFKASPIAKVLDSVTNDTNIYHIADEIMAVKEKLQDQGLDVNRMIAMQKFLDNRDFRGGVSEFGDGIQKSGPVNRLQAVASKFSALKIGSYSNQIPGGGMNQELFLTGAHVTVKSGFVPLTLGYGSVNDMSAQKDAQYQGSVYNQPRNVTFFGAELKNAVRGNLKISVISSFNREVRNNLYAIPTVSSNTVAFTLSKGVNIGQLGQLGLDVSKSTTLYANKFQPGAEVILDRKGGLNQDLSNDLFQALSFGVSHHLDLNSIGATDNVYFNYSGMGYQNPANNGFGGAKMKFGGNIKKSFYGNRLSLNLRTDMTNMPISYTSNDRWKNYQVSLESRYTVSKGLNAIFKYTNNGTDKRVDGLNTQVYGFEKFQLDGNASYKIGRNFSVSHFGMGTQAISSPVSGGSPEGQSRLLILNYVQSVVLKRNVLSFTMFYNRELTAVKMIGNMLNTDMTYSYTLFRRLSASSGVVYLDNTGIVRQAGIRQSLNLVSGGHFDVGSFVDLRKDMIRPLYSGLYPGCRAELSLKYHLNAF